MEDEPIVETPAEETPPAEDPAPEEQAEAPAPAEEPPRQTLAQLLEADEDYRAEYEAALSAQVQTRVDGIRIDLALESALNQSGARNHKAVLALIEREKITVKDDKVSGITEQMDALKKSDPYLFANNGGRPYFGAPSSGGNPGSGDDAIVAARYRMAASGQVGQFLGMLWVECSGLGAASAKYYDSGDTLKTVSFANVDFVVYNHETLSCVTNFNMARLIDSEMFFGCKAQVEQNTGYKVRNADLCVVHKHAE